VPAGTRCFPSDGSFCTEPAGSCQLRGTEPDLEAAGASALPGPLVRASYQTQNQLFRPGGWNGSFGCLNHLMLTPLRKSVPLRYAVVSRLIGVWRLVGFAGHVLGVSLQ
jgi:hypothetical protein